MRKPDLAAAIAEKADLTKEQANRVLNAVLEEITQALHRKDSVTLVGFGTFIQRHLEILSEIAELLSDRDLRERLKTEEDPARLHELISRWEPMRSVA